MEVVVMLHYLGNNDKKKKFVYIQDRHTFFLSIFQMQSNISLGMKSQLCGL